MRKNYRTTITKPVTRTPIERTSFALALPPSIAKHETFSIGPVRFAFRADKKAVKALDPIPKSWFVDISKVVDLNEENADLV